MLQLVSGFTQTILDVNLLRLVPGKREVQACQIAVDQPLFQLRPAKEIVLAIAFAEQQPVALLTLGDPCLEQAAQPGETGAVTQQNHWHGFIRQVEATVAAHAQADVAADRGVLGQPAGSDAQAAIGVLFLTHDQLQHTVSGDRGNRVLAHRQRHHRIHQRLRVQADQMRAVFRQLA